MDSRGKVVTVAAVSAGVTLVATETLRYLLSKYWKEKEEVLGDDDDDDGAGLPELGKKLRDREFSHSAINILQMNNGSYGNIPRRVQRAQLRLIDERESWPEHWYRYRWLGMYRAAVKVVAEFVCARPDNLVLVENVTSASNCILKSFKFQPGDKVLLTNHTYNAVLKTVEVVLELNPGVSLVVVDIPLRTTVSEIIAAYTKALQENPGIKMAVVDHITSGSVICMPINELTALCHNHNVIIAIDGAHAPGQLPLNLEELGADFYFGNLHKWLFNPRGCALLYVHPKHHSWIRSAVSSHEAFTEDLQKRFYYTGTRDATPYFTAKHAIHFLNYLGGLERVTAYNQELAYWAAEMLSSAWKTSWVELEPELRAPCMCLVVLPETPILASYNRPGGVDDLMEEMSKRNIDTCARTDGKQLFIRISAQAYNYKEEYYLLRDAFNSVLEVHD